MSELFSIGYATKELDSFLAQLQNRGITAIADVRSVPYSKVFHNYHREALAATLRERGVHYVYLGEELGPRSKDPTHYDEQRQIQFERLQAAPLFQQGIERVFTGLDKGLNIALLCAEKDPAVCHRSLLIGQYLLDRHQLDVQHLDHEGEIELESALQDRLVEENGVVADMFSPPCECVRLAWVAQCRRYAYRKPED